MRQTKMARLNILILIIINKGLIRITILAKTQSIEAEIKDREKKRTNKKKGKELEEKIEENKKKNTKLKELEAQIAKIEKLQKIKIEEKRVSKEFDVSLISAEDVERLLKFLQLNPDDDKYTLDKKLTNKNGYPKVIIFDGLEGSYSDTHSIRDNSSSYRQKREELKSEEIPEDKYSSAHPSKLEELKYGSDFSKDKEKKIFNDLDKSMSKSKKNENKELVAIDEEELNNQPESRNNLEDIIDPEGKKEQWKLEEDQE